MKIKLAPAGEKKTTIEVEQNISTEMVTILLSLKNPLEGVKVIDYLKNGKKRIIKVKIA